MKIFKIYFNPEQREQSIIILQEAMSFKAAIFNWLWAAAKQMWTLMSITLILQMIISLMAFSWPATATALSAGLVLGYFLFGESLYANHLERRGYKLKDIILANDTEEAELKYYSRNWRDQSH